MRGDRRLSRHLHRDSDLLREPGRDAFLPRDGFLRLLGDFKKHAVNGPAFALPEVRDSSAPELALHVEGELVPAQDRGCALRKDARIYSMLSCPLREMSRG